MLVEFSTGNYAPNISERIECFKHKPHMGSLTPGIFRSLSSLFSFLFPLFLFPLSSLLVVSCAYVKNRVSQLSVFSRKRK